MAKDAVGVGIARQGSRNVGPGGKLKVSDRLEEDAQAMEERLIQLRMKMLEDKQKLDKELPAKFGGSRWRSAQEGIGSVSRYAKDVEEKLRKPKGKKAKDNTVDTDAASSTVRNKKNKKGKDSSADSDRSTAAVALLSVAAAMKWTTQNVLVWLSSLGLDEFHSAFEYHQVTGRVLLEMQMGELTQIGVTRLSARNLIWRELEAVKSKAKASSKRDATEIIDPKIRDVATVPEVSSPDKEGDSHTVHWSQVKPLRDMTVALGGNTEVPVNLADGEFNEDDSHASFLKALLDWRAGDDDAAANGECDAQAKDDGMWFNPMGSSRQENEQEQESEVKGGNGGGGALWEGEYDEAKEQEAFQRAVQAWRRSGTADSDTSRPSTAATERIEQGSTMDARKSCWQCYRVMPSDNLQTDPDTGKAFCGPMCQSTFYDEHARLYAKR